MLGFAALTPTYDPVVFFSVTSVAEFNVFSAP